MNNQSDKLRRYFSQYGHDNNHLPLLFLALEQTKGDVFEFGMGFGSTPYLFEYCVRNKRALTSFETVDEWANKFRGEAYNYSKFKINIVTLLGWDVVVDDIYKDKTKDAVLLLDHAPGESRGFILGQLSNFNGIIVAHDTEESADHGYQMRKEFAKFKYVCTFKTDGVEATALSNTHDITKWKGEVFNNTEVK